MNNLEDNEKYPMESEVRCLTEDEHNKLKQQNERGLVSNFHQMKLEKEASKNWDKFYKRNETRFFKDRHWTTREFEELVGSSMCKRNLLEVGCGVGNFFYPLLEDGLCLSVYACDFSPRAIDFVKQHPLYEQNEVTAFVHDLVKDDIVEKIGNSSNIDFISMIFVLSAVHPDKMSSVLMDLIKVLKPGGLVLFRDYAVNDMAMIRFKPGSKLGDRFYVRQDGTRAFYFEMQELADLFISAGYEPIEVGYIKRQTVNKKEAVNATRMFLQGKFQKPIS